MAREIDLTKKLSEDDLRYLVDRGRWDDLRRNADSLGLDAPNLPSARGIRAQVPPREIKRRNDDFDQIASAMGVKLDDDGSGTVSGQSEQSPAPQGGGGEEQSSGKPDYDKMTVLQLKEEMDSRRERYEREDDSDGVQLMTYSRDARKDDLVSALQLDDDSTEPEAEAEDSGN